MGIFGSQKELSLQGDKRGKDKKDWKGEGRKGRKREGREKLR